jgi:hypothetical protein
MFYVVNALLRAISDDVCLDGPIHEAEIKATVAAQPIENGPKIELGVDSLKSVERRAILPAPSMWN